MTATVERVTYADGSTRVRKLLRRPVDSTGPWAASEDPRHWNYWRRELEVYRDEDLRKQLSEAGLALPETEVVHAPDAEAHAEEVHATQAEEAEYGVLLMEDVGGVPGTEFLLEDHAALARACGRWQAQPAPEREWTSRGFLRDYSTSRAVQWDLVDDDAAWQQPLVADIWPGELRSAWLQLLAHRDQLLDLVASLPRARCHLDFWVSNVIKRPTGELVLLDWAFTGDGALGEDMGNHIPDAVFDLFWPAERLPELAETCVDNYLEGLREGGWRGDPDVVRLAVMASTVKYAWLLPHLLARASDRSHSAYHQEADSQHLFHQRGQALAFVANWCAEAIRRSQ